MTSRFELFSDGVGRFRFRILAANGHLVAVSSPYASKAAAKRTIAMVRNNARRATVEDSTLGPSR